MSATSPLLHAASIQDLRDWLKTFSWPRKTILYLEGNLGAGKTELTRQLVWCLGGEPFDVASPTYSLHHIYRLPDRGWQMHHWDLYRVSSAEELEALAWYDLLDEADLIVVEWGRELARPPQGWQVVAWNLERDSNNLLSVYSTSI